MNLGNKTTFVNTFICFELPKLPHCNPVYLFGIIVHNWAHMYYYQSLEKISIHYTFYCLLKAYLCCWQSLYGFTCNTFISCMRGPAYHIRACIVWISIQKCTDSTFMCMYYSFFSIHCCVLFVYSIQSILVPKSSHIELYCDEWWINFTLPCCSSFASIGIMYALYIIYFLTSIYVHMYT